VRRANVLQRVLYLVFRTAISASHKGVEVPLGGGQTALAFLRVLLYICDQAEERAILCFKSGGSAHTCSCCTVATKDMVSSAGLSAEDRDVLQTLEKQLEAADRSTTETIGVGGWCLRVMKASTAPCLLWRLSRVFRPHHCSFTRWLASMCCTYVFLLHLSQIAVRAALLSWHCQLGLQRSHLTCQPACEYCLPVSILWFDFGRCLKRESRRCWCAA